MTTTTAGPQLGFVLPPAVPPDVLTLDPPQPVRTFRDVFGNRTVRFVAPAGPLTLCVRAEIEDDGELDPVVPEAREHPVEDLPEEVAPQAVPLAVPAQASQEAATGGAGLAGQADEQPAGQKAP